MKIRRTTVTFTTEDYTSPVIMNPTAKQKKNVFDPYIKSKSKANKKVCECLVCGRTYRQMFNVMTQVENIHVKHVLKNRCQQFFKVMDTCQGGFYLTKLHTRKVV